MFDIHKLANDTDKTQKILTGMLAQASGWDTRQLHPEDLKGPIVFLYIWDRPTQWAWMCSIQLDVFNKVTSNIHNQPQDWENVRGSLATVLNKAAGGAPLTDQLENELGLLLSAYAGTTQVLQVARNSGVQELHFIVLNYRGQPNKSGKLRPFVLPSERTILTSAEFYARVQEVISLDTMRHPEWF